MNIDSNFDEFVKYERKREPYKIFEFIDKDKDLKAFLVIDTLKDGKSYGGCRVIESVSLNEIKALAKSMTLKYSFLKRTMGGAKCGISIPKNCTYDEKIKILNAFGKKASYILKNSIYTPWTDMNSSEKDIHTILKAANCPIYKLSDSSYFTALTVVSSIKAACEFKGLEMNNTSVIIEGFGNVGSNVAKILESYGVKIVGVSTISGGIFNNEGFEIKNLLKLRNIYSDNLVNYCKEYMIEPKEVLYELETDIIVPCARPWSINKNNMNKIKAKIIVPGANNPFADNSVQFLSGKDILCLPDFICNVGGILGSSLFDNGLSEKRVYKFIMNDFSRIIKQILISSYKNNITPIELSEMIAYYNHYLSISKADKRQNSGENTNLKTLLHKIYSSSPDWFKKELFMLNEKRVIAENIRTLNDLC